MSQAQIRAAVSLTPKIQTALDRVVRATSSATSTAKSATNAIRADLHVLAGARIERVEKLLRVAREELAIALTSLRQIELGGVAAGPIRWDLPPPAWWTTCASELRTCVNETLGSAERTEQAWNEQKRGEYMDCVRKMADEAKSLRDGWDLSMHRTRHWREVVVAIDDGLPASHSVARTLPL